MGIFSLIRISNFEHGPKPDHFYVGCRQRSTICGRKQTHIYRYSGTPVDKMSAMFKYFFFEKLESKHSLAATCNICNTSISQGGNKTAAFHTTNLIRHIKNKHPKEHTQFTQTTQAKAPTQKTLKDVLKKKEKCP